MIKNEFEPYDVAFALKELGFDKSTLGYYQEHNKERTHINEFSVGNWNEHSNRISAPLSQQAFRFFREEYGLYVEFYIIEYRGQDTYAFQILDLRKQSNLYHCCLNDDGELIKGGYSTHSGAEEASLKKLIEIVNQNKDDNKED